MPRGVRDWIVDQKHRRGDGLHQCGFPEVGRHVWHLACQQGGKDEVGAGDCRADVVAVGNGGGDHGEEDDGPRQMPQVVQHDRGDERHSHTVVQSLERLRVHIHVPHHMEQDGGDEGEENLPLQIPQTLRAEPRKD